MNSARTPGQPFIAKGLTPGQHPDTARTPRPPSVCAASVVTEPRFEIVESIGALVTRLSDSSTKDILLDTETLGLGGVPFLIQLEDLNTSVPTIIRVRDHAPNAILDLVRALVNPHNTLVGHNLVFDLAKLTHLATVASVLAENGKDWSEEAVWEAERIWRPAGAAFQERLARLQIAWPLSCIDTLIASHRLPPFANELQGKPGITFKQVPVAAVPRLVAKFRENLNKDAGGLQASWLLGDHLHWTWDDKPTSQEKRRRQAAMDGGDLRVLGDVRFTVRYPHAYSLKTLAPLLGYDGQAEHQDFDDIFGKTDQSCPVWTERGGADSKECGHRDAWEKSLELEREPEMLRYAAADIGMLRVVLDHYRQQPGFAELSHDMALVPWAAAVRMIGIHIDQAARDKVLQEYQKMREEGVEHCKGLGLNNINSPDQVLRYVNKHVVALANVALPPESEGVDEVDNARREDTLEPLLKHLQALDGVDEAEKNLELLIQARMFDKKLQFVESIEGDSVFPSFRITGTETDRMSCSKPNSQQMPSKETDWEREHEVHFRAMFTPPPQWRMLTGDFDQLELRLKSGVTKDPATQQIYANETRENAADEHSETALKVFNEDLRKLLPNNTDAEILALLRVKDPRVKPYREKAKPVGFGTAYGASEYGISRSAGCPIEEGRRILDEYWRAYPTTKAYIDAVRESLTAIRSEDSAFGAVLVENPRKTEVTNLVGVPRHFRVTLRLIRVAGKMADTETDINGRTYLEREFPELAMSPVIVRRGRDYDTGLPREVSVLKALRSALRGGAFGLQRSIHRKAFNHVIQSLGSFMTKTLQAVIYAKLVPPGIHAASELRVLPGLQVHDEIHLFHRGQNVRCRIESITREFLSNATSLVGCPIRFKFEATRSWAEK